RFGLVRLRLGERAEAEKTIRAGLEQLRGLLEQDPASAIYYRVAIAEGLNVLGQCLMDTERRSDAEPYFRAAIAERHEVLKIDPDNLAYKRSLADSMNTFGAWFNGEGRRQEAVAQFREAAHFYRELVEKAPTDPNLLNELVRQLSNLGDMLQLMLDY